MATKDIKDSALDKVMYILENLKSDIKIMNKAKTLDIEPITKDKQKINQPFTYKL